MSCTDPAGEKIILPRGESFPETVRRFAEAQPERLKWLAALFLRKEGWTCQLIADAFGHAKGHVARETKRLAEDLHHAADPGPVEPG